MGPLPDKPAGCEITDAADANGVTLSWPAYKAGSVRYAGGVYPIVWLCVWFLGWGVGLAVLANGRGSPFLYVWFVGWTCAGFATLVYGARTFQPPTPEFVRLEPDALRYDPGRGPDATRSCAELPDGRVVPVKPFPATEVTKAAVRGFGIDRVQERQRLYFDSASRRVEIGGCLTESEREWLFGVLQQWFGATRPAPAWSREARRNGTEARP